MSMERPAIGAGAPFLGWPPPTEIAEASGGGGVGEGVTGVAVAAATAKAGFSCCSSGDRIEVQLAVASPPATAIDIPTCHLVFMVLLDTRRARLVSRRGRLDG
jgi:hypothetical protein